MDFRSRPVGWVFFVVFFLIIAYDLSLENLGDLALLVVAVGRFIDDVA